MLGVVSGLKVEDQQMQSRKDYHSSIQLMWTRDSGSLYFEIQVVKHSDKNEYILHYYKLLSICLLTQFNDIK